MAPLKQTSSFIFHKEKYGISLVIDYEKKTYHITPNNNRNEFKFLNANEKTLEKWNAIAELILEATKFASEELFFGNNNTDGLKIHTGIIRKNSFYNSWIVESIVGGKLVAYRLHSQNIKEEKSGERVRYILFDNIATIQPQI